MKVVVDAEPEPIEIDLDSTAIVIIDMQRDFLEPGGFGETLGNNVSLLQAAVEPNRAVLEKLRELGLTIIHTREGHLTDLSDGSPVEQAEVTLMVRPKNAQTSVAQTISKVGRVTGIYVAELTPPSAGDYDIEFHIKNGKLDERLPLTDFKVE